LPSSPLNGYHSTILYVGGGSINREYVLSMVLIQLYNM
jgi:hypothetical protein